MWQSVNLELPHVTGHKRQVSTQRQERAATREYKLLFVKFDAGYLSLVVALGIE